MSLSHEKCRGCGASLGERHSPDCRDAHCWRSRELCAACDHCKRCRREGWPEDSPFLYTGELEPVFSFENRHYIGFNLDEYDYEPTFTDGRLTRLLANRVGPGAWHHIETSRQARDLIDLTLHLPHLTLQTGDDCVRALLESPLTPRLRVLQLGDTARSSEAAGVDEDGPCEGEDTEALARLVERMPRAAELYLAIDFPDLSRLLAATFPPPLEVLMIRTYRTLDLGVLARNQSLGRLGTLVLHQERGPEPLGAGFHDGFSALVNSPGLDRVADLRIDVPQLDDECVRALVTSRAFEHLRRLGLNGEGLTDAGAALLAACPAARGLEAIDLSPLALRGYPEGGGLTRQGVDALRAAGIKLSPDMDITFPEENPGQEG
jgi:hypothetical protein